MVRSHLIPLVIAGPTASGKSALAMDLACRHGGEIICADSRQFYAGMSIGTACPSAEDLSSVTHHGYGSIDPLTMKIDAGFFVSFALAQIKEIQSRNKRPILVGGTGLYLRSLRYGLHDVPPSDKAVAEKIDRQCDQFGLDALYAELKKIDPVSAQIVMPNDRYRITRALEIFHLTGQLPSDIRKSFSSEIPKISAHWIYKKPDRAELVKKLEARVKKMFDDGLVEEAKALKEKLPEDHWVLSVMGYQEALLYLSHKLTRDEAIELIFIRHRQYAKRQYTWFNREPFYRWIIS